MALCGDRQGPSLRLNFGCVSDNWADFVMAAAEECDIELLFVPAGGTNEY
jgi:hypothetical protein